MRRARGLVERMSREGPVNLYNLARFRAVYAGLIGHGKASLSEDEKTERLEQADLAMTALRQALAAGYADGEHMKKDEDLAVLRERADFKQLLAKLDAEAKVQALAKTDKGTPQQTLESNREVMSILQKLAAADPQNKRYRADLATSQHAIGLIETDSGKLQEAAKSLAQALAIREKLVDEEPKNAAYRADLAASHLAVGNLAWKLGRYAEGERGWQKGLAMFAAVLREDPHNGALLAQSAGYEQAVAIGYAETGLWEEAAKHLAMGFERQAGNSAVRRRALACLRLLAGDKEGYRKQCTLIVEQFGKSSVPQDMLCVATACTLAPEGFGDLAQWVKAAEEFAETPPKNNWASFYVGLAKYRAGRFEDAVRHLEQRTDWVMTWPALAMSYHRLGKPVEARRWLKKVDDWYEQTMRAAVSDELQLTFGGLFLWDRPQLLLLYREAQTLIDGAPRMDPWLDLWQGRVYTKLGHEDKAEAHLQSAVAKRANDPNAWLARGRVFAELGEHERAQADFAKAIEVKPDDAQPWIARGRYFTERGEHTKADADFSKAASLSSDELNQFIEGGWWVAGPYPYDLRLPCAPEKEADPSKSVAGFSWFPAVPLGSPFAGLSLLAGLAGPQFDWKPCPTEQFGTVRRGHPVVEKPRGPVSVYGLTYVYSPDERPATLLVGGDLMRVWLNSQLVYETSKILDAPLGLDRVPVTLRRGRNTLLVKPQDKDGSFWFRVLLADCPLDRGLATAEVGLCKEAAAAFIRFFERESTDDSMTWYSAALAQVLAGDTKGYGRLCEAMRAHFGTNAAKTDLRVFLLAPEGAPDTSWLVQATAKAYEANSKSGWRVFDLGVAQYRAGQFAAALRNIQKARNLGEWVLYWPVLAMTYHRLGQADKAREWLHRTDQYFQQDLQQSLGRTPFKISSQVWQDWAWFEIFRREAKELIEGKPAAEDQALLAALRARAWTELREHGKAQAEFAQAVNVKPEEARLWIARGRYYAERGEPKRADADFAKAAALTSDELNKFVEGGWWVAGPYPGNLRMPCAPEQGPDPSKPVAMVSGAGAAGSELKTWRSAPTHPETGLVHLAPLFNNAQDASAYAMAYVFSPEERSVLLRVGGHGNVRLWLNGGLAYEASPAPGWEWALDLVPVTLQAGRNTLLVKVAGGGPNLNFLVRIADAPFDRAWMYADLGLLKEASEVFAKQFKVTRSDNYHLWRMNAMLLLVNGDTESYRRVCADMLERWGGAEDSGTCAHTAMTGCWGPAGTVEANRLLDLAKKAQQEGETYRRTWLGVAHYRAAQYEEAIRVLNEVANGSDTKAWSVLAMAHHQLKKTDEARQWLKKAEEHYDATVREALAGETLKPVRGGWVDFVDFLIYYREAKALIDGPAAKDLNLEALQARGREELMKRNQATAAYDHALMLRPDQPRLWLARGRRHADLKQWDKAEADLAKAMELKPGDLQAWKERAHVYTGLGKKAEAAAALAKGQELTGAFVVLGDKGAAAIELDSLANAVDAAGDGDTIEVRKNGPFATQPIVVRNRALVIRAKAGLRPVLKIEGQTTHTFAPILKTDAPLVLEGLEFQRLDQENSIPPDPKSPSCIFAEGKSIHLANCRFRANIPDPTRPHRQVCIIAPAPVCVVRNCEFLCPAEVSVDTSSNQVSLENCLHVGRLALTFGNAADCRLKRNTLVAPSGQALHFFLPAEALKQNQAVKASKLDASGNIITAAAVLYVDAQHGQPKPLDSHDAKAILPRALAVAGRENLYQGLEHSLTWTGAWEIKPSLGPRDLDGWRKFWGSTEIGSIFGSPQFKGGDLAARLAEAPDKITPEDFRLVEGSPGSRAGKDGKDLGADVNLVGPGKAYERWKKTPEYQQWLKDTGQIK